MSGQADQQMSVALARVVHDGPLDVIDLLAKLRATKPALLRGQEGALHAFLHARVRSGELVVQGRSPRSLSLYGVPATSPAPASTEVPEPEPLDAALSRAALRIAKPVRDPAAHGRVLADVIAHRLELAATGRAQAFGPERLARHLLHRADRGRRAVCFAAGGADKLRRFALHEGPWILSAVAAFFLLRAFVVEVYKIPSESMRPTLEVNDRVVVFKLGGQALPDRWSIVVFEHERGAETINVVKRVVGLPGEEIYLLHGDVYIDGKLLVKPEAVREQLRFGQRTWRFDGPAPEGWSHEARPEGGGGWQYDGPPLFADRLYGRGRDTSRHSHQVMDGYLVLDAVRAPSGTVVLALSRGEPEEPGSRAWQLSVSDRGVVLREGTNATKPEELARGSAPPPGPVTLRLAVVDGIVRAAAGDWSWRGPRVAPYRPLRPSIGTYGAGSRPVSLRLDQDIHYAYRHQIAVPVDLDGFVHLPNPHRIPAGHVFFLGDNSLFSDDSRSRGKGDIRLEHLVGPVRARIWPPSRIGGVR